MKVKIIACLGVFLVGISGLMVNDISKMNPETIVMCTLNEGGILIPAKACEYYLYNHRDIASDVYEMSNSVGLSFILEGKNKIKKYEIASFFILNGLSVNSINYSGGYNITPLHGAVIGNDLEMVSFLLSNGASISIKAPTLDMTP
ncbi:ankyrin repeat domain-containing protein, partial [Psychromonas antarctica]|uniref:ankyrin repeat domain-containing protein n=1 Tax=Psychromonas antarctica TaxID=67573 RepID=UPI001EE7F6F8